MPEASAQVVKMARPAGAARSSGSQARIRRQLAARFTATTSASFLVGDMSDWIEAPSKTSGIADQTIEPSKAPKNRLNHAVDIVAVAEVERHQGRGLPQRLDPVIDSLEARLAARHQNRVVTLLGEG